MSTEKSFVVSERDKECARKITLDYDFGVNLEESTSNFNAEVVYNYFLKGIKVGLQAFIRRLIKAGKSDDEILTEVDKWIPGVKAPRSSAGITNKALVEAFKNLSADKRKELIEKLMADKAAAESK